MMFETLKIKKKELENILQKIDMPIGLNTRVDIYRERTLFIDFNDKYLHFAIDISISKEDGFFAIETVFRNKETDRLFNFNDSVLGIKINSEKFESDVTKYINEIINKYNCLYEFEVSVIIPIYNRVNIITGMINSLNAQLYNKSLFEVIFIDDASSDGVDKKIISLIDPNINYKIITRTINSGGASIPRNEGILASRGKYLFFADSDDQLFDYTLQDAMYFLAKHNSDVVYLKMTSTDGSRAVPTRTYKYGNVIDAGYSKHHLCRTLNPIKLYRSSLIKINKIQFPLYRTNEDRLFSLEAISKAKKISILGDKAYYNTFHHDNEQLTKSSGIDLPQYFEIMSLFLVKITNSDLDECNKHLLFNNMYSIILDILISLSKKHSYEKILLYFKQLRKLMDAFEFKIDLTLSYSEHKNFSIHFMNYDYYRAWESCR